MISPDNIDYRATNNSSTTYITTIVTINNLIRTIYLNNVEAKLYLILTLRIWNKYIDILVIIIYFNYTNIEAFFLDLDVISTVSSIFFRDLLSLVYAWKRHYFDKLRLRTCPFVPAASAFSDSFSSSLSSICIGRIK